MMSALDQKKLGSKTSDTILDQKKRVPESISNTCSGQKYEKSGWKRAVVHSNPYHFYSSEAHVGHALPSSMSFL